MGEPAHREQPYAQITQITSEHGVYWSFRVQMYADPSRNDPRGAGSAGSTAGSTPTQNGQEQDTSTPYDRQRANASAEAKVMNEQQDDPKVGPKVSRGHTNLQSLLEAHPIRSRREPVLRNHTAVKAIRGFRPR